MRGITLPTEQYSEKMFATYVRGIFWGLHLFYLRQLALTLNVAKYFRPFGGVLLKVSNFMMGGKGIAIS